MLWRFEMARPVGAFIAQSSVESMEHEPAGAVFDEQPDPLGRL
jgi:hypothetical protein